MSIVITGPVLDQSRVLQMCKELEFAIRTMDGASRTKWIIESASIFPKGIFRRSSSIVSLVGNVATGTVRAAESAYVATIDGRLGEHLQAEGLEAYQSSTAWARATGSAVVDFAKRLRDDPAGAGTDLFVLTITALAVSGGPDGDGGVPDMDLMMGIGAHRAFWSHSIIAGSALETLIFALLGLVKLTHAKLPEQHDKLWDRAHDVSTRIATSAAQGASIGIAYHLFVDGLLQPAAYHGLPVSMPMEGHEALQVLNAQAEALDVDKKGAVADSVRPVGMSTSSRSSASCAPTTPSATTDALPGLHTTTGARIDRQSIDEQLLILSRSTFVVDPRVEAHLTIDALRLLRRHGKFLQALDQSLIKPVTHHQQEFVAFARGRRPPTTEHERIWHTYRLICARLGI